MRSIKSFCLAAAALFAVLLAPIATVHAEQMTWHVQSDYSGSVIYKFYSDDFSLVWPDNGSHWTIDDYESHPVTLNCQYGQMICYGASPTDASGYWGVGYKGNHRCDDCCYQCGESSPNINFTDNPEDD